MSADRKGDDTAQCWQRQRSKVKQADTSVEEDPGVGLDLGMLGFVLVSRRNLVVAVVVILPAGQRDLTRWHQSEKFKPC